VCAALAPDSFFEASALPEIWTAMPVIQKLGGIEGARSELKAGKLKNHTVLNAIAMGLCYAAAGDGVEWPIDQVTGAVLPDAWKRWKAHDPIEFLQERRESVANLTRVLIDCGTRDQFHLQYGSRQIRKVLEDIGVPVDYSEFEGGHFDLRERRPLVWKWLKGIFQSTGAEG
jgi:enterochelin esterase family protein